MFPIKSTCQVIVEDILIMVMIGIWLKYKRLVEHILSCYSSLLKYMRMIYYWIVMSVLTIQVITWRSLVMVSV